MHKNEKMNRKHSPNRDSALEKKRVNSNILIWTPAAAYKSLFQDKTQNNLPAAVSTTPRKRR